MVARLLSNVVGFVQYKHTGELIGFTNRDDINDHLDAYKPMKQLSDYPLQNLCWFSWYEDCLPIIVCLPMYNLCAVP
jgi:hypothetical protein